MQGPVKNSWRTLPIEKRLTHALVNGISEFVDEDTEEARQALPEPLHVSEISQRVVLGSVFVGTPPRSSWSPFAGGR